MKNMKNEILLYMGHILFIDIDRCSVQQIEMCFTSSSDDFRPPPPPANNLFGPLAKGLQRLLLPGKNCILNQDFTRMNLRTHLRHSIHKIELRPT